MMDNFFKFCLYFSTWQVILPVIIISFWYVNKEKAIPLFCIYLFTLPLGMFLKSLWQVPLLPHLGEGWSFPSGHMLVSVSFWGLCALLINKRGFYLFAILLVACIGQGLVVANYHIYSDVYAAIPFGLLNAGGFFLLLQLPLFKKGNLNFFGYLFAIVSALLIEAISVKSQKFELWAAVAALVGFSTGLILEQKWQLTKQLQEKRQKIFIILVVFLGLGGGYFLSIKYAQGLLKDPYIVSALFFLAALWFVFLAPLVVSLKKCFCCKKNGEDSFE